MGDCPLVELYLGSIDLILPHITIKSQFLDYSLYLILLIKEKKRFLIRLCKNHLRFRLILPKILSQR